IEASLFFEAADANGFQQTERAEGVGVGGVFGLLEGDFYVALRGEVVDFVGLHFLDDVEQGAGVGEVAVMEDEMAVGDVRVLIEVVDAAGVEERSRTLDAMDLIPLLQEKFSEVGSVLSGDSSDDGFLQAAC